MGKIIKREDVIHISRIAEIDYDSEEIDKITVQMDKIIKHVARISEADTDRIAPTFNVLDISNVLREDEPRQSVKSEEALKNAPERSSDGFKIPKIDWQERGFFETYLHEGSWASWTY